MLISFKILISFLIAGYLANSSSNVDYLGNNVEGNLQYDILLNHPSQFLSNLSYDFNKYGTGGLFNTSDSFWGYLRFNLLYKLIALLDIITYGNFYLNTILFSTVIFLGHIAFYRIYNMLYPTHKRISLLVCFVLPSLLLYTACIHKDGFVFLSVALLSYLMFVYFEGRSLIQWKYMLTLIVSLLILFVFRNYVLLALLPAIAIAVACKYVAQTKKPFVITFAFLLLAVLFFVSSYLHGSFNLPNAVVQRKADFATLEAGTTNIPMNDLQPTVKSFAANLPQALNHFFLRPYLWEFRQAGVLLTAIELFAYQLIFLLFLFYRKKGTGPMHNFNIFALVFFFNMALIIGYTIPNVGAIVRYRSIFWILVLCPTVCNINWQNVPLIKKLFFSKQTA